MKARLSGVQLAIGLAGATLVMAGASAGQRLQVVQLNCPQGVQLNSRGTPLSQVLQRMSEVMSFEVNYWARDDPPIDHDAPRTPLDLMNALSLKANLMVRYAPDRRCSGQWRVKTVWVLPAGSTTQPGQLTPGRHTPRATSAGQGAADIDPGNQEHLFAHGMRPIPDTAPTPASAAAISVASPPASGAPPAAPVPAKVRR